MMLEITILLLYKQKTPGKILIFKIFIAKFWMFTYFSQKKICNFQVLDVFMKS